VTLVEKNHVISIDNTVITYLDDNLSSIILPKFLTNAKMCFSERKKLLLLAFVFDLIFLNQTCI